MIRYLNRKKKQKKRTNQLKLMPTQSDHFKIPLFCYTAVQVSHLGDLTLKRVGSLIQPTMFDLESELTELESRGGGERQ